MVDDEKTKELLSASPLLHSRSPHPLLAPLPTLHAAHARPVTHPPPPLPSSTRTWARSLVCAPRDLTGAATIALKEKSGTSALTPMLALSTATRPALARLLLPAAAATSSPSTSACLTHPRPIHYDADADKLREVIDRSLAAQDAASAAAGVHTGRSEARSLYRLILRTAALFTWADEGGAPWKARLIASARSEFEATAAEVGAGVAGPEEVARRLVVGRAAVSTALEKVAARAAAIEANAGGRRPGGGGSGGGDGV